MKARCCCYRASGQQLAEEQTQIETGGRVLTACAPSPARGPLLKEGVLEPSIIPAAAAGQATDATAVVGDETGIAETTEDAAAAETAVEAPVPAAEFATAGFADSGTATGSDIGRTFAATSGAASHAGASVRARSAAARAGTCGAIAAKPTGAAARASGTTAAARTDTTGARASGTTAATHADTADARASGSPAAARTDTTGARASGTTAATHADTAGARASGSPAAARTDTTGARASAQTGAAAMTATAPDSAATAACRATTGSAATSTAATAAACAAAGGVDVGRESRHAEGRKRHNGGADDEEFLDLDRHLVFLVFCGSHNRQRGKTIRFIPPGRRRGCGRAPRGVEFERLGRSKDAVAVSLVGWPGCAACLADLSWRRGAVSPAADCWGGHECASPSIAAAMASVWR